MPLTGGFLGGTKPVLEIKPTSPFVVFYGEGSEGVNAELTGKLVLTNPESMSVRSIKMSLSGSRKVSWSTTNTVTPQPILSKQRFLYEELSLFPADGTKNKAHKINAGVHEWDFKFTMPSTLDESLEGLGTNWIVYNLSATVDRGYMSKQLSASQHIRVIRTLSRDVMESVPMDQINEDIWASKIAYKITVPQKNYIVGTSITADFVLIPLRKGVEVSTIKMEVIESRLLYNQYAGRRISHNHEMVVAEKSGEMPANAAQRVPEGVADTDALFDECNRFKMTLELPKSLKNCRQSIDTENIRITHKLRLYVNLLNPEGHTSQLLVKNHLHLFISPNLPPGEDQSCTVDPNVLASTALQDEVAQNAPPTYGLHQLDELYNDIDPSGFMTPGVGTGANTPFYAHSRTGSHEDLSSLDAVANQTGGGASAVALHSRLHNLSMGDGARSSRFAPSPSRRHSSGTSTPHNGGADSHQEPSSYFPNSSELHSSDYDMDALVRTPSYNTAVRTPGQTPIYEDLPTYEMASRPASPSHSHTPRSGRTTPSSARSLDTLTEETQRNTQLNSRRQSPRDTPRTSNEGRHRFDSSSTSTSISSSLSSSSSGSSSNHALDASPSSSISSTRTPRLVFTPSTPPSSRPSTRQSNRSLERNHKPLLVRTESALSFKDSLKRFLGRNELAPTQC